MSRSGRARAPARIGLALVRPRAALAIAGDREHAGRSGTDLLAAIAVMILVTRTRALVASVWLGVAVDSVLGFRAVAQILTDALAIDLGFLVLSALVIWAASGPRRDLGRASDLACVAVLPVVVLELAVTAIFLAIGVFVDVEVPAALSVGVTLVGYAWTVGLAILAASEARRRTEASAASEDPPPLARRTGWGVTAMAVLGLVAQVIWMVPYLDRMRPVAPGDPAPQFALPLIDAKGGRGAPFSLSSVRGKIVVIDFWATWCQPCVKSLPRLEAVHRQHPEVAVLAIDIDDPADARALFDEGHYTLTLLAGSKEVSDRYNVGPIPHTVLIDALGIVRQVHRGGRYDLEREISALGAGSR